MGVGSVPEQAPQRQTLQSWKEIAAFLGVTVRSVQRWEAAGLPVYRQGEGGKARVFAYAEEIQAWVASNEFRDRTEAPAASSKRGWRITYALAAVAAVIVAIVFLWRAKPAEPESWTWDGTRFVVFDSAGRPCWEKQFPAVEVGPERAIDQAMVADLDGDGRHEVLFNMVPVDANQRGGSLLCYERNGRVRWEHRFGGIRTFGDRTFEPNYRGRFVRLVRINRELRILTIANHFLWYPSQVALLDPQTGRVIEEYWHPGSIYHCVLHDVDGDGQDEVIFGAINNPGEGLGHAAVGILKIPFSKAPRLATPTRFPPPTGGGELAYGLLPLPDICRSAAQLPKIQYLTLDALGRLRVQVPAPDSGGIVYYLDKQLRVLEFHLTDNFSPTHERLYRGHLLDHRLGPEETQELGRLVMFPAAPDGNSPEVKNLWKY